MKTENEKLKHEITPRWRAITETTGVLSTPEGAQLEYILQEAGLLAKPRKRRVKTADENLLPQHTLD